MKILMLKNMCGILLLCFLLLNSSGTFALSQSIKKNASYALSVAGGSRNASDKAPYVRLGENYMLGPGDVLDIKIFGSTDLDRQVRVGGDGYISMPLIGSIVAGGLSVPELEFNIAYEYSRKYLRNPQVSVYVLEFHSKTVTVIGEVGRPQVLELSKNSISLLELLSLCGGLTGNSGDLIYIIRPTEHYESYKNSSDHSSEVLKSGYQDSDYYSAEDSWEEDYQEIKDVVVTVKISELVKYHNPVSNMQILPGDTISIPSASYYFVFGEIAQPGAYLIRPGMTVLQAITQAGKLGRSAKTKIKLIREDAEGAEGGEKVIKSINFKKIAKGKEEDIEIEGGDVLLIGKSTSKEIGYQVLDFTRTAVGAAQSAMMYQVIQGGND